MKVLKPLPKKGDINVWRHPLPPSESFDAKYLSSKNKRELYLHFSAIAETLFLIETEKIFYLAGGYEDDTSCRYYSGGYVIFADVHTFHFFTDSDNKQDAVDKCQILRNLGDLFLTDALSLR